MSDDFSQDENRKTLRSFYCRDYMWELFEQMTRELGCSMDYLINEAMRQYAQNRDYSPSQANPEQDRNTQGNYSNPPASGGSGGASPPGPQDPEYRTYEQVPSVGGQQGGQSQSPPPSGGGSSRPQQPQQQPQPGGSSAGPPPPPSSGQQRNQNQQNPNWQRDQQPPTKRQNQSPSGGNYQQQQQPPQQSGPQQSGRSTQQQTSGRDPLYLLFNNNRYEIDQNRFVIGRGSSDTDLTIRDGNISRKHCAIIYRNNNWYLKDLDSTNGVEFRGNRIESKRIEEGDIFYLCDYPLQFTYRG